TILVSRGIHGRRTRERVPAEGARGRGHQVDEPRAAKRRHWIAAPARPLEDVPPRIDLPVDVPGGAGHADFVLDLVVVALELVDPERPVLDGRPAWNAGGPVPPRRLGHHLE